MMCFAQLQEKSIELDGGQNEAERDVRGHDEENEPTNIRIYNVDDVTIHIPVFSFDVERELQMGRPYHVFNDMKRQLAKAVIGGGDIK